MPTQVSQHIDERLRLRLADLDPELFESFFLQFLRAGISLTAERHGRRTTGRIINAETYAAGSGRNQKGIDVRAEVEVEGGKEIWVFQCKRHKTWTPTKTRDAIKKASQYPAQHYFLIVACDPHEAVQDEIHKHANWTFWNLDTICAEFRLRVHPSEHVRVLSFLSPEELKRFVPFTTKALIRPDKFFERFLGADKLFRHNWKLVGRKSELQALRNFASGTHKHKVQILSAKGGDGKSRLLWEFCRTVAAESPETEVLCLNPHRSEDDFEFAFTGNPPRRLILVDDAHRTEQVPLQLLALARQDPAARVLLATRPQGVEALAQKLYETGLSNDLAPQLSLPSLKKSEIKTLAAEVLGEKEKDHARELTELTAESPFLTVIAGDLLRQARMEWGKWTSHDEFRGHVFREFEQQNVEAIPEVDRRAASGLMRMLALLAPAVVDAGFSERAAHCLGCSVFELETQLNRLRQSELVAGRDEGLRIVPDLFADFLVYETCYGARRAPAFVQKIIREFEDYSPALLRNLSEATWIARLDGVADEALLNTVLEPERRRFEAASSYERAGILRHWSGFSIYLPAESLELAKAASAHKTAPQADIHSDLSASTDSESNDWVGDQLPPLLRPIARYHDQHRHAALDLLWELGLSKSWPAIDSNRNHAWAVIADVIKFEPKKWVAVTIDALAWLKARLRQPGTIQVLEGTTPVLRALVSPCFARVVEFSHWEGRMCHFCRQPVSVPKTRPIRESAFEILAWVIEHGSPRATLDALSALQTAIRRVTRLDAIQEVDEAKLRAEWRPERLKALALIEAALEKHPSFAVRYEIRQILKTELAYEEDAAFAKACHRALAKVPEDLALRVAVTMLPLTAFEFEEEVGRSRGSEHRERVMALWNARIRETAQQLAVSHPTARALFDFLEQLAHELVSAGNHLYLGPLFADLAHVAPALAAELAEEILEVGRGTPLVGAWPALIEKNEQTGEAAKVNLFRKAPRSRIAGASAAVVRFMASRVLKNQPLSEAEQALLLEIAARAAPDEAYSLLQLVEWSGDANMPLVFQILQALPIRDVAPQMLEQVLQSLVPYTERTVEPPRALVHHILQQLVSVRDLDLFEHDREWDVLTEKYPRACYELMRERILHASSGNAPAGYNPIPSGYRRNLSLSGLVREQDHAAICDELWNRVSDPNGQQAYAWVHLFQAVVFESPSHWTPRMRGAINGASSENALLWLAQLLKFEGSLIIFRFPEITRAFLIRARALGGGKLSNTVRVDLYSGCGPQGRLYSSGVLDKELDYVEAEAAKAAEAHASDDLLGPFYRWIVEIEQKDRLVHKMRADAAMASLD